MDDLRQLFHTLNNQLGIILTHAELIEAKAPDDGLRKKATTVLESTMDALRTVREMRTRLDAWPGQNGGDGSVPPRDATPPTPR